ncbi:MAG: hypothetical protein M9894_29740 [Planctomycetes bacterium]|nr:hypothetical protein [Planctomycetota bacterium]
MAPRLPWYAFLYRLFGAQGTFWLWVLALVAIWWTAKPTVARLANRHPREDLRVVDLAQLSATDPTRWVALRGVEVRLDRALLLRESTGAAPAWLLLDPSDPSATWWARTRALADMMVSARGPQQAATAALGGVTGVSPKHARQRLQERLARLEGGSADALPTPGRVVLVQRPGEAPAARPPRAEGAPNPLDFEARLAARLDERAALIRERVRPGRVRDEGGVARVEPLEVQGLLVPTPSTLAARVKQDTDTVIGPWVLQADREPRDLESWVFAVAAVTLLFLIAGFVGATRDRAAPAPAA